MFKDLSLKPVYYSKEQNIAAEFYIPVLSEAISFNRVSAYFSAKGLAHCAKGLEYLSINKGKCRLIISKDISEEDYLKIKKGYDLKQKLNQGLIADLKDALDEKEEQNMSNLAYLIAQNLVEIKIAFMKRGTFHYKFGIYKDNENNIITSCGSDNFTEAAIEDNAESFNITCNWQCSDFDYPKITLNVEKFENLWNNTDDEAEVLEVGNEVFKEITKYNKGKLFLDNAFLQDNSFILDYNESLIGYNKLSSIDAKFKAFVQVWLKRFIKSTDKNLFLFKENLNYTNYIEIIEIFKKRAPDINLNLTESLLKYINSCEIYINDRSKLGICIKKHDSNCQKELDNYKNILSKTMSRQLREQQLWDSFFMYSMRKSSNFSVPGSGKTSSVLGVYAYLQAIDKIDRIIVISPKNAFGSWQDEFNICFKDKQELKAFNIQENISIEKKHEILNYNWRKFNLLLFNYESVGTYKKEIKNIISKRTLLVFDEVHKVKGINKIYANQSLEVAKDANYVITMTGTPIPNTYADIYNNLNILFPNEYETHFGFLPQLLAKPNDKQKEEINDKIRPFFCRTSKDDLNVPKANEDEILSIITTDVENKLFNILYSKFKKNKLALIVRLLQLEAEPSMLLEKINPEEFKYILEENDKIEDLDFTDFSEDIKYLINSIDKSSKMEKCISLTTDLIKENKSVIIWTIFKKSIYKISEELNKFGIKPIIISGDVKDIDDRLKLIDQFKNNSNQVLITNPHTLAESVSLHSVCHDAIYFEYSYNLVHLLQSKDRIHRLGLPDNQYTQYYFMNDIFDFNGNDYSLDNEIYQRLKLKEQIMLNAISNDKLETIPSEIDDIDEIFKRLGI